jgi:restriction endonuclease S subunit
MSAVNRVLGDVVRQIEAGRSPKTLERDAAPDEPGVLKVSAVSWGSFNPAAAKAMPATFTVPESHKVRRGDFIVSRANTAELTGAVAIADADYLNRFLSDKLLRLVLDNDRVVPEYLLFALRAPSARAHIERSASGTSDSMRNIAQDALLKTPIVLPDLEVQRRLAARLRDAAAAASHALSALLRQAVDTSRLTLALLRSHFGSVGVMASGVPRAGLTPLRSLARLESGHTPSRRHPEWWGGDVPWLALPDIRKLHGKVAHQTAETTNAAGLANSSARLLPAGAVCVSRTASIGFVTMLGRPMATSQDFCNWICDPGRLDPEFLMYAFMASQDQLRELGSGAVHKTIYMPTIESFHLHAPALDEQRRIARALREQLAAAEALQARLAERQAEIERLPQRILAAAFGDA